MKVRLNLSALTRLEFTKEVEVPDDTSDSKLQDMVNDLWSETDGGEFWEDPDFFEKGTCYFERLDEEGEPTC